MDILDILTELNESNSSNYKKDVLTKYKDNNELKSIFKYTYDKIDYTYGVTSRTIQEFSTEQAEKMWEDGLTFTYPRMFELLERLSKREFTGHKALAVCKYFALHNEENRVQLFYKIIDRDLKVNVSEKTLNKIWKGIVPRPNYCRCGVLSKKLASKIEFPCYIQLKCDGTYRECYVNNGKVQFKTRSGEGYSNPILENALKDLPNGYYLGEFTIGKADEPDANRSVGNGNINSDNPDFENIHFTVWDCLNDSEYNGNIKSLYCDRFQNLVNIFRDLNCDLVHVVPTYEVQNLDEALKITSDFMNKGLEGGILKDKNMIFKNGTSNQQLKIKLKVDCEMRITGFTQGTGKRAEYIGAITFENDEKTIKGQCSGFNEEQMKDFTANKDKYIGKVISVEFNDLTKAESNDYYALMHPRFIELRMDKDSTDSLDIVKKLCEMAKNL